MTRGVMPGKLMVVATTPDGQTISRELDLPAGTTQTLLLALPRPVAPPPASASVAPVVSAPPPPPPPPSRAFRVAGFAALGVGTLGAVVLGVEGLRARSKMDEVRAGCGSTRCNDPRFADTIDQGKTAQTLANVGLVITLVGAVAGASFFVLDAREERSPTVSLDVGRDRFFVGFRRAFP
jgi:hypothetical protein